MSRATVARRIATAAAFGGGGIGLLGGAAVGLLLAEAQLAKRRLGVSDDVPPMADGLYGTAFGRDPLVGRPLLLGFLGDSTAAGQGVHRARQTPGALLASGLAAVAERPVELRNVALSGAMSDDLERQVTMLLSERERAPEVCVIMIGANDVTGRMPLASSVRHLSEAVARLRTAGSEVVVGTCPDLGSVEPVGQPLRWLARRLSRQLAAAQTIAVVELGGRTVSLGDLLGPEFAANPGELFGPDNYHPSAEGYATAGMAVLPTLCATLGLWPTAEEPVEPARREGVLPVARAAAEAAAEGGTEVVATRGPWAQLRHRRRRRVSAQDPEPTGEEQTTGTADPAENGTGPDDRETPAVKDVDGGASPHRTHPPLR
ncbi:SGNH/GDSL hydrolase family protein [Streptomyces sp. XM4193]|uniref:SGNH/GDSL hydrolase family protein n=1 Tax=Streptomyces sp. XM4193 TaxID=2929782 RepID=UPI001FFB316E|nr:SGNH/GDSL hydrolase family protein [Streptomyces sp. XM4193]MCK1796924.1 SGNH/GDSL hydrolase family protein [Streptomyces sp. XM4193]